MYNTYIILAIYTTNKEGIVARKHVQLCTVRSIFILDTR